MSTRAAAWLAWSMWTLSLVLTAFSLLLLVLNLSHPKVPVFEFWAEDTLTAVGFSTVGAVIVPRVPLGNPIGWLFCAMGLVFGVLHFSAQYARYALVVAPGSLPAGQAAAWIFSWAFVPAVGLLVFLVLLFPDGRLPSRRWRWFVWLGLPLILVGTISQAFAPGLVAGVRGIYNPLGVGGLPNVGKLIQTLLFALLLVSVASLVVRWRRASGVARQQLKWFTYAATLTIIGVNLAYTISPVLGAPLWLEWVGYVLALVGLVGIPISMGIAILKYRLYEIDFIINRTLVYGAVTVVLAGIYEAIDAALHYVLVDLTHQHSLPGSIVAALVIAALFHPVRHRIQRLVDGYLPSEEHDTPGHREESYPS
jgi:hypothetical protein